MGGRGDLEGEDGQGDGVRSLSSFEQEKRQEIVNVRNSFISLKIRFTVTLILGLSTI